MIELKGLEIAGLYLFLKGREQELSDDMSELAENLEMHLYERLSIQEMEELKSLYENADPELDAKI